MTSIDNKLCSSFTLSCKGFNISLSMQHLNGNLRAHSFISASIHGYSCVILIIIANKTAIIINVLKAFVTINIIYFADQTFWYYFVCICCFISISTSRSMSLAFCSASILQSMSWSNIFKICTCKCSSFLAFLIKFAKGLFTSTETTKY